MYNILIVEDELLNSMLIEMVLEDSWSVSCTTSRSAEEALQILQENRFDLVIMDIMLAGILTGIDAVTTMQEDLHINTPVIYITASSDTFTFEKAKKTTMVDYMRKPLNVDKLKANIENLFAAG